MPAVKFFTKRYIKYSRVNSFRYKIWYSVTAKTDFYFRAIINTNFQMIKRNCLDYKKYNDVKKTSVFRNILRKYFSIYQNFRPLYLQ